MVLRRMMGPSLETGAVFDAVLSGNYCGIAIACLRWPSHLFVMNTASQRLAARTHTFAKNRECVGHPVFHPDGVPLDVRVDSTAMSAWAFVRYLHPHPRPDQGILHIEGGTARVERTLLSAISDRRVTAAQRALAKWTGPANNHQS